MMRQCFYHKADLIGSLLKALQTKPHKMRDSNKNIYSDWHRNKIYGLSLQYLPFTFAGYVT